MDCPVGCGRLLHISPRGESATEPPATKSCSELLISHTLCCLVHACEPAHTRLYPNVGVPLELERHRPVDLEPCHRAFGHGRDRQLLVCLIRRDPVSGRVRLFRDATSNLRLGRSEYHPYRLCTFYSCVSLMRWAVRAAVTLFYGYLAVRHKLFGNGKRDEIAILTALLGCFTTTAHSN